VATRYTDVTVLGVFVMAAGVLFRRLRRGVGLRGVAVWALAAAVPLGLVGVYDTLLFGGPLATGYSSGAVSFSLAGVAANLRGMPARLVEGTPLFLLAGVAPLVAAAAGLWAVVRRVRTRRATGAGESDAPVADDAAPVRKAGVARFVPLILAAWWAGNWALYLAYDWTARQPFGRLQFGFPVTTRFNLLALGAIALLAAWLMTRSRVLKIAGVALAAGLLTFGVVTAARAVDGDFLYGHGGMATPSTGMLPGAGMFGPGVPRMGTPGQGPLPSGQGLPGQPPPQ